jgi:hypothetical protein
MPRRILALILAARKDRRRIGEVYYAMCAGVSVGNVETFLKATTNMTMANIGHFSVFSLWLLCL